MGRRKGSDPTQGVTVRLKVVTAAHLQTIAARVGKKFNTLLREILEAHVENNNS